MACLLLALLIAVPAGWFHWERFDPPPSFRIPYNLSNDYFLYTQWAAYASARYPALVVGDSFVWGEYAASTDTLSGSLNKAIGRGCFANLGLNGLHPAAAEGLMRYYGGTIKGKHVLVHFNPLWVQSRELDLRGDGTNDRFRVQHPRLVPQLRPRIKAYHATPSERVAAVAERYVPFIGLRGHIKSVYFGKMSTTEWLLKNPYANPFPSRDPLAPMIQKSSKAHSLPESWEKKGIPPQDYPWVQLKESFQWTCFLRELAVLRTRGNEVFVLLGPFNPYLMTPRSLSVYRSLRAEMEASLKANGIAYYLAPDLPSNRYTDASHVAREGYAEIAGAMLEDAGFANWLKPVVTSSGRKTH
ncbi:MAG: hypothetical protein GXP25_02225 [Planctomycetes bacterium]|nr:hypothetical protein [Planctomycetota bacterium]